MAMWKWTATGELEATRSGRRLTLDAWHCQSEPLIGHRAKAS